MHISTIVINIGPKYLDINELKCKTIYSNVYLALYFYIAVTLTGFLSASGFSKYLYENLKLLIL